MLLFKCVVFVREFECDSENGMLVISLSSTIYLVSLCLIVQALYPSFILLIFFCFVIKLNCMKISVEI